MKEFFLSIILKIYSWFFKSKPTKEVKIFIESLFFVFIATGIAKGLLFIMNIIGGRVLGEAAYGEYTLIISVSSFLMIPVGLGVMGGITKMLAETPDFKKQRKLFSTSANYFILTLVVFVLIYFILSGPLSSLLKIGSSLFLLSIVLIIFWTPTSFFEAVFQGLHQQKKWSYINAVAYIAGFITFLVLFFTNNTSILLLFIPMLLTYATFVGISAISARKHYSLSIFNKKSFKNLFHFGIFVLIISIATTFLGNVDKLMINYFLGAESVGVYQAFYFSSIMIIGVLTGVFIKVFFPTAVKLKNPKDMLKKLDKISFVTVPVAIIFVPFFMLLVIYLYNYEFSLFTAVLFAIATAVDILVVFYSALLNAQGVKHIKKTTTGLIIAFLLNIPLNFVLIQAMGINGAIIATTISFFILFLWVRLKLGQITRS